MGEHAYESMKAVDHQFLFAGEASLLHVCVIHNQAGQWRVNVPGPVEHCHCAALADPVFVICAVITLALLAKRVNFIWK